MEKIAQEEDLPRPKRLDAPYSPRAIGYMTIERVLVDRRRRLVITRDSNRGVAIADQSISDSAPDGASPGASAAVAVGMATRGTASLLSMGQRRRRECGGGVVG